MNNWNQLLLLLDKTIGFPNKIRSSVRKKWQGYDQWKNEHVIMLEYRIRVNPGSQPQKPPHNLRDLHGRPATSQSKPNLPMATIRELMDVGFVNTVDSSPSLPSAKKIKKKTAPKPAVPKKTRPNPPSSPSQPV